MNSTAHSRIKIHEKSFMQTAWNDSDQAERSGSRKCSCTSLHSTSLSISKSLQTDFHLNESSFWLEGRNSADKLRWFGATGMILKEIKAQTVHRLTCHTPPVWATGITQTAPHPPQSLVLLASGGAGIRVDVLLRGGGGCHTLWRGHQLSPPQPVDVPALPGLS